MHQNKRANSRTEPIIRKDQRVLARAQLASLPLLGMTLILEQASTLKLAPHITPSLSILGIAFILFFGCSKLLSHVSLWNIHPANTTTHNHQTLKCCFFILQALCLCLTSREMSKWFSRRNETPGCWALPVGEQKLFEILPTFWFFFDQNLNLLLFECL